MRIVHYHRRIDLTTGGVVRAVLDLCTGLAGVNAEVTLLTPEDRDVPDAWRGASGPGTVRAVRMPAPGGLGRVRGPGLAMAREHLEGADALHLHGMWDPANLQLAAIARRLNVPYVISVHGMLDDWSMAQRGPKKRVFLGLAGGRRMLEAAAAVHCTATAELEQARRWFPRGRGVVIPLIFDVEDFRDLPGPEPARTAHPMIDADRPTLLFLSRIHYKKGIEHLVGAAARLRDAGRPVTVIVAGTGDDAYVAELEADVRARGLEDLVHFIGFVSGRAKVSLYEAADVFVLPTSQENFGFVLFEALAAGTPVVTTRGADTWPEMEASGGSIVTEGAAEPIADAVASLLDDPDRRRRMGEAGRAWVMANLSPDAVVAGYRKLYEGLAGA